jgi:hypothetical protein
MGQIRLRRFPQLTARAHPLVNFGGYRKDAATFARRLVYREALLAQILGMSFRNVEVIGDFLPRVELRLGYRLGRWRSRGRGVRSP